MLTSRGRCWMQTVGVAMATCPAPLCLLPQPSPHDSPPGHEHSTLPFFVQAFSAPGVNCPEFHFLCLANSYTSFMTQLSYLLLGPQAHLLAPFLHACSSSMALLFWIWVCLLWTQFSMSGPKSLRKYSQNEKGIEIRRRKLV